MFRNYNKLDIEPHAGLNIITGNNAQGKTNLIESIFLNLKGYSYRSSNDKEVVNWEGDTTNVSTNIIDTGYEWNQTVSINSDGIKKFFINGVEKKKKDIKSCGVVLFSPDDLSLIKNSPVERRKYLDLEIGPYNSVYDYHIKKYNQILAHRNKLLKNIRDGIENLQMLDIWDEQLVDAGTAVLLCRITVLKKLVPLAIKWYSVITGGSEELEIRYLSSLKITPPIEQDKIKSRFFEFIVNTRKNEIKICQTTVGPHRDDLIFLINGKDAKMFGSQGQQRSIVLSLKLAQVSLWIAENNTTPILLLDDVMFELDDNRQKFLISKATQGIQTFITTCCIDQNLLINKEYKIFMVERGSIISNTQ